MKALFLCNMDIYWKGRLIIQIKKAWNNEIVFTIPNNTIVKVWLVKLSHTQMHIHTHTSKHQHHAFCTRYVCRCVLVMLCVGCISSQ